jgi:ubiquitin carboxyl-terminal hydrolase 16/45
MIGGHYIAYTLVDPEKMFVQAQAVVTAMANVNLESGAGREAGMIPNPNSNAAASSRGRKDRRVWCFCSE